jgi:hypothetical protein
MGIRLAGALFLSSQLSSRPFSMVTLPSTRPILPLKSLHLLGGAADFVRGSQTTAEWQSEWQRPRPPSVWIFNPESPRRRRAHRAEVMPADSHPSQSINHASRTFQSIGHRIGSLNSPLYLQQARKIRGSCCCCLLYIYITGLAFLAC